MNELKINEFLSSPIWDLFNRPQYYTLHAKNFTRSFYFQFVKQKTQDVIGSVHLSEVEPNVFRSPAKGSFGCFEINKHNNIELFDNFRAQVESFLLTQGAKEIYFVAAPFAYNFERSSIQTHAFLRANYEICAKELNYSIPISEKTFFELIDHGNRKHINKCIREGFEVKQLSSVEYEAAYNVIVANRKRKNYPVSMSWESLQQMIKTFPNETICFGVFDKNKIIASSICFLINSEILYVFYWGELGEYIGFSPVALLAKALYEYSQKNNFKLLDLGVSTLAGQPDIGLIRFKTNLGAVPSLKFHFSKKLTHAGKS